MGTKHTQIDDTSAEDLVASYGATGATLEQSDEKGRQDDDRGVLGASVRTHKRRAENAEADALLAEIERRRLDV